MATALTALATTTLASSSATVTFSSISGAYRDLRLVIMHTNTGGATQEDSYFRFNGDTGANYSSVYMRGSGGSTNSGSATNNTYLNTYNDSNTENVLTTLDIMDYSATDKHKTTLMRQGSTGAVFAIAGRWASTAAITSISMTSSDFGADSFIAGSTFTLFGIASA